MDQWKIDNNPKSFSICYHPKNRQIIPLHKSHGDIRIVDKQDEIGTRLKIGNSIMLCIDKWKIIGWKFIKEI